MYFFRVYTLEKKIKEFLPQFGYKLQRMKGIDDIAVANLICTLTNKKPNSENVDIYTYTCDYTNKQDIN